MPLQTKKFTTFLNEHKDDILLREPCGKEILFPLLNGYSQYKTIPQGHNVYCVCSKKTAVIYNNEEYILMDGDFRKEMEEFGFKKDFFEVLGTDINDYLFDIRSSIPMYF